ncbi:MAG: methyltransferase domain-containing protein [Anaerolineae bacterium]
MAMVNLGCGRRYHPDWVNIDIVSSGPGVIAHDITTGIPLANESCRVVYHAHVLEHLRANEAFAFVRDCYRVLGPGGVIRVAVPDLERICRTYLDKLGLALDGDADAVHEYDWIMLEMYDQTVREQSGGQMLAYLRQTPLPCEAFVYDRIGEEGRELVTVLRDTSCVSTKPSPPPTRPLDLPRSLYRQLRLWPAHMRAHLVARWLGESGMRALAIGRFRLSGEVHHWMYDRYSLARLLTEAGFVSPSVQTAITSSIPGWTTYNLDTTTEGRINKPDSLFMEATKPS